MKQYLKNMLLLFGRPYTFVTVFILPAVVCILERHNIFSLQNYSIKTLVICAIAFLGVFIPLFVYLGIYKLFASPFINTLDFVILIVFFSTGLYAFSYSLIFESLIWRKLIVALIILGVAIICLIIRMIFWHKFIQNNKGLSETITLDDLFDESTLSNKIEDKTPILLEEKDSSKDLLDRGIFIQNLYDSIVSCKTNGSFVIGLKGEWGSGKTTLLNIVKQKIRAHNKNYIVIDKFDPWIYESNEALLYALIDEIALSIGMSDSFRSIQKLVHNVNKRIGNGDGRIGIASNILDAALLPSASIDSLKGKVEKYLSTNDQRLVIIIDNLDRASPSSVISLLKLIPTVLNFKNTVYVLAYDNERIIKIVSKTSDIDSKYLEKIIQKEVILPHINKDKLEILINSTLWNALLHYGIDKNRRNEFDTIFRYLKFSVHDLRAYKRYINTVLPKVFHTGRILYDRDLLAIETIQFFDIKLYNEIIEEKRYYIEIDTQYDPDIFSEHIRFNNFEQSSNEYYSDLKIRYKEPAIMLLAEIFPILQKKISICSHLFTPGYNKVINDCRICSAKFFETYFTYGSNQFAEVNKLVLEFIDAFNAGKIVDEESFGFYISEACKIDLREWLVVLRLNNEKIAPKYQEVYIFLMISLASLLPNDLLMFEANQRDLAIDIIGQSLLSCDEDIFNRIIVEENNDYKFLSLFYLIGLRTKNKTDTIVDDSDIKTRREQLASLSDNMCKNILDDDIDIYSKEHYSRRSIWILQKYAEEKGSVEIFNQYIKKHVGEKSVYYALADCVGFSRGNNYRYRITKDLFFDIFESISQVDQFIANNPPKSEIERFVCEVYNTTKPDFCNDDEFEGGVIRGEFLNIDMI